MIKKVSSLVLAMVVALLLCQTTVVAECRSVVAPQATHIAATSAYLSINSGNAVCQGTGRCRYADTTTHLLVTLQRRATGTNTWWTVCMWGATASGTATARVNQERAVSSGYDYRVFVKCTIKDADGTVLETGSAYSNIVSY